MSRTILKPAWQEASDEVQHFLDQVRATASPELPSSTPLNARRTELSVEQWQQAQREESQLSAPYQTVPDHATSALRRDSRQSLEAQRVQLAQQLQGQYDKHGDLTAPVEPDGETPSDMDANAPASSSSTFAAFSDVELARVVAHILTTGVEGGAQGRESVDEQLAGQSAEWAEAGVAPETLGNGGRNGGLGPPAPSAGRPGSGAPQRGAAFQHKQLQQQGLVQRFLGPQAPLQRAPPPAAAPVDTRHLAQVTRATLLLCGALDIPLVERVTGALYRRYSIPPHSAAEGAGGDAGLEEEPVMNSNQWHRFAQDCRLRGKGGLGGGVVLRGDIDIAYKTAVARITGAGVQDPSFRVWKHNSYTQYSVHRSMLHFGLSYVAFTRALLSIAVRRYGPCTDVGAASVGPRNSSGHQVSDAEAPLHASVVSDDLALRLLLLHQVLPLACRLGIVPSLAAVLIQAPGGSRPEAEDEEEEEEEVEVPAGPSRAQEEQQFTPPSSQDADEGGEVLQSQDAEEEEQTPVATPDAEASPAANETNLHRASPMPPLGALHLFTSTVAGQQQQSSPSPDPQHEGPPSQLEATTRTAEVDVASEEGAAGALAGTSVGVTSRTSTEPSSPALPPTTGEPRSSASTLLSSSPQIDKAEQAPHATSFVPVYAALLDDDDAEEAASQDAQPHVDTLAHARDVIARTLESLVVCGVPLTATPHQSASADHHRSAVSFDRGQSPSSQRRSPKPGPLSCDTCARERETVGPAEASVRSRSPSPSYAAPTMSSSGKSSPTNSEKDIPGVVLFGPVRVTSPSVGGSSQMRSPSHQETLRRALKSPRSQASAQVGPQIPSRYKPIADSVADVEGGSFSQQGSPRNMRHAVPPAIREMSTAAIVAAGALRARQRKADAALAQEAMQSMADATLGLGHRDISPDASSHAGTDAAFRPYGSRVHELEAAAAESLLGPELRALVADAATSRSERNARHNRAAVNAAGSEAQQQLTRVFRKATAARLAQPRTQQELSPTSSNATPNVSSHSRRKGAPFIFVGDASPRSQVSVARGSSTGASLTPPIAIALHQGQGATVLKAALSAGLLPAAGNAAAAAGASGQQRPLWLPKHSATKRQNVPSALNSPAVRRLRRPKSTGQARGEGVAAAMPAGPTPVASVQVFDDDEYRDRQLQSQRVDDVDADPPSAGGAKVYEFVSQQRAHEMSMLPQRSTLQPQHLDEASAAAASLPRDEAGEAARAVPNSAESYVGFQPGASEGGGFLSITPADALMQQQQHYSPVMVGVQSELLAQGLLPRVFPDDEVSPSAEGGGGGPAAAAAAPTAPPHPGRHIGWASTLLTPQPTRGYGAPTAQPPSNVVSGAPPPASHATTAAPPTPDAGPAVHADEYSAGMPTTERKQKAWVRRYEAPPPPFASMLEEEAPQRPSSLGDSEEGCDADFPAFDSPPHAARSGGDRSTGSGHQPYLDTPAQMRGETVLQSRGTRGAPAAAGGGEGMPAATAASQTLASVPAPPPRPQSVVHISVDAAGVHVTSSSGDPHAGTMTGPVISGTHPLSARDGRSSVDAEGMLLLPESRGLVVGQGSSSSQRSSSGLPLTDRDALSSADAPPQGQQQGQGQPSSSAAVETTMRVHRSGSVEITTRPATPALPVGALSVLSASQPLSQQPPVLPAQQPRRPSRATDQPPADPAAASSAGPPRASSDERALPPPPPQQQPETAPPDAQPQQPPPLASRHALAKSPRAPVHPPPEPQSSRSPPQPSATGGASSSSSSSSRGTGGAAGGEPLSQARGLRAVAAAEAAATHAAAHAALLHRAGAGGLHPASAGVSSAVGGGGTLSGPSDVGASDRPPLRRGERAAPRPVLAPLQPQVLSLGGGTGSGSLAHPADSLPLPPPSLRGSTVPPPGEQPRPQPLHAGPSTVRELLAAAAALPASLGLHDWDEGAAEPPLPSEGAAAPAHGLPAANGDAGGAREGTAAAPLPPQAYHPPAAIPPPTPVVTAAAPRSVAASAIRALVSSSDGGLGASAPDLQQRQQQQQDEVWAASELLRSLLPDPLSASAAALAWHAELLQEQPAPAPAPPSRAEAPPAEAGVPPQPPPLPPGPAATPPSDAPPDNVGVGSVHAVRMVRKAGGGGDRAHASLALAPPQPSPALFSAPAPRRVDRGGAPLQLPQASQLVWPTSRLSPQSAAAAARPPATGMGGGQGYAAPSLRQQDAAVAASGGAPVPRPRRPQTHHEHDN